MVQSVSLGPLGLELLMLDSSICRSSHRTHTRSGLCFVLCMCMHDCFLQLELISDLEERPQWQ